MITYLIFSVLVSLLIGRVIHFGAEDETHTQSLNAGGAMYRIVFDPNVSRFVVQILVWHFFWKDCYFFADVDKKHKRITFDSYKNAARWVENLGLHDVYTEQRRHTLYKTIYPEAR